MQTKTLLIFDKDLEINREKICEYLNSNTKYLKFELGKDVQFDNDFVVKPNTFLELEGKIDLNLKDINRIFCFTDKQYLDNYFLHEHRFLSIFSFNNWSLLTDLSKNNGFIYFVIYYFARQLDDTKFRHHEETGCIYDFLWSKDGIDDGMRQSKICPNCLERITSNLSEEFEFKILDDLKSLMNILSNNSKWNQDILTNFKTKKEIKLIKRKTKTVGVIKVAIASPGDTQSERELLLDKLEIQFRRNNHEEHCSKRLIVNGWEELASQNGYPQDIINEKIISEVDIVIAIFKHKLGTPTIDIKTGKVRAESGTVEELLQAIDNKNENHPLGMSYFYSKAPQVSLDSPKLEEMRTNWNKLQTFKESIRNKMIYKPYLETQDLMKTILIDLEKNIKDNFE